MYSYLALGAPIPCCCSLFGNGSGGAKFSLVAEISPMARTVQNNLIEKISREESQKVKTPFFLTLCLAPLVLVVVKATSTRAAESNSLWGMRYTLWCGQCRTI